MPEYPVDNYVAEPCYTPCPFNSGMVCRALSRCASWSTSRGEATVVVEEARGIVEDAEKRNSMASNR